MVMRETRFLDAAAERGVNVTLTQPGSTSYLTDVTAARELLSAGTRPDGVFCVINLIVCGFIDAARHEFGLRIPEEISTIGFDDIEQASWLGYDLTTFAQPLAEMAEAACQLVIAPATGTPSRRVFKVLPVRRSTLG